MFIKSPFNYTYPAYNDNVHKLQVRDSPEDFLLEHMSTWKLCNQAYAEKGCLQNGKRVQVVVHHGRWGEVVMHHGRGVQVVLHCTMAVVVHHGRGVQGVVHHGRW